MPDLSPDARLLLAAFAAADGPVDWYDVVAKVAGTEPSFQMYGDNTDHTAWLDRANHLTAVVMLLFRDGLLESPPDGVLDTTVITEAGREVLLAIAQRAEQKTQNALGAARREAATTLASLNKRGGPEGAL